MDTRYQFSPAEVKKVRRVQFGILSPDEIRQMSVVQIEHSETTEKGKPKPGGLSDPRLGTIDRKVKCETCNANMAECPGHFGHLELAKPMFHIGFMKTVLSIMRCVCFNCSKILIDEDDHKFKQALRIRNPKHRLKKILDASKNKAKCEGGDEINVEGQESEEPVKKSRGGCGAQQPKLTIEGMKMIAEYKAQRKKSDDQDQLPEPVERKQQLSAERVLSVLKRISDEDCIKLGLNPEYARPDWMILQVLPIPPPPVRPSVMMDTSSRSEDDLTHQLAMIIRHNENLRRQERNGAPAHIISEFAQLLQFHIATYFDNELPGQPRATQRSGRPIKSICSRLKAKEGRIRGNLMGKRVDFSARTVITPDPTINIDELGVPWSIALNLTYPETVTPYNIERLKELVEFGPHPPPGKTGAKYIIREDGQRLDLRYLKKSSDHHLELGYKVERHLQDGDFVLFNRQPSLHKMSIMGHRIKIMPYSTFRLNLSVTSPYNADFDGDEMNMHVPQSFETRAEVLELMMVPKCIVSPQANRPVMGIVQDTLLGCRKITKRDTFIEKDVFMNILMWWEDFDGKIPAPAILKPRPLWTGKQVFNLIIPKQINLMRTSAWHSESETGFITPGDTQVRIEKGELLAGTLCKKTLGTSTGSLIHVIWEEVGPDAARKFLGHTQWLVNYWLLQNAFSIGIGDTIADASTMEKINETISKAKNEVKDLIRAAQEKQLEPEPGRTMMESFENRVNQVLNKARDDAGSSAQKSLSESNNLKAMVTAGSKGSFINISQMTACVGQQNVEGKRIPFGFIDRTLPHFTKDDYGPESRGFVENSYLRGLTPQEFFFHAMGGREGLIDTAVKTSETGYIQRRLVKAMEDIMVKYDGTVRNSLGDVIQFLYGEDGMDAVWIETQKLDSLKMKKSEFNKVFRYEIDDESWNPSYMLPEHVEDLKTIREFRNVFDAEVQKLEADRYQLGTEIATTGDNSWPMPVNLKRLIWNAQKTFKVDLRRPSDMHPMEIVEAVDKLQERLKVVPGDDFLSMEAQKNATLFFNILLRSTFASKRVLKEYRLTREAFEWVIGEIESRFLQSLVAPGEMIGCVAAQSIGEPATQMTLNTFHYAGVSAKNVTLGVPRLREIINVAKKIKTPSLSVYLKPEVNKTKERAKNVQCALEYTTLRSVTQATEVWYDPDPMSTIIEEDIDFVKSYYEMPDEEVAPEKISPWLLRIELNREMMVDKKLSMADIAEKINLEFDDDLTCIFNDDNAEKLILRIRIMNDEAPKGELQDESAEDDVFLKKIESNMLTEMALRGIPDINKVFIKSGKVNKFDENEGFKPEVEWMLDTEGVNLLAVMCHEDVDATRTTSNHLIEVIEVLGIEAVRRALLDELRVVISSNSHQILSLDSQFPTLFLSLFPSIMFSRASPANGNSVLENKMVKLGLGKSTVDEEGEPTPTSVPLYITYNERIRPLLDAVDKLRQLKVMKEGIELPTIVVVGDQSSGKSSVLESLAGINLPRGLGICTRVPLIMRLQQHSSPESELHLEYLNQVVHTDEDHVAQDIEDATIEIAGTNKGISNTPLSLVVKKRGIPDLTMVDLPGITRVPVRGQPEDIYEQISEIIKEHITPKESIILNVLSATVDFPTCESIRMSQQVDKSGLRTLAVVTKADQAPEGLLEKVTADDVNIGLGYVCVRNRIGKESYEEARKEEARLFQSHPLLSKIDKSIVGIPVLAQKLVQIQASSLAKCLPDIVKKINEKLNFNVSELDKLPKHLSNVTDAMTVFMQILGSTKESLRKILIRGEFDEYPNDKEMHCTARMADMLNVYSKDLHQKSRDPAAKFLMEEIKLLEESKGIELPNFLPRTAFLSILQSRVKEISNIPVEFIDKIWSYIGAVVVFVLMFHSDGYPQLQSCMRRAVQNLIEKMKEQSVDRVTEMVEMEKLTDYTCSPEYMSKWSKLMALQPSFKNEFNIEWKPSKVNIEGMGQVEVEHLREYSPALLDQAFDMRMRITAYWETVLQRLVDSLALHLVFNVQKLVNKEMEKEIVVELMGPSGGGIERLLEESPSIATKRERLNQSIRLLRESKKVVGNIMDRIDAPNGFADLGLCYDPVSVTWASPSPAAAVSATWGPTSPSPAVA